jgi:OmpA-OmpF porin, OOP family
MYVLELTPDDIESEMFSGARGGVLVQAAINPERAGGYLTTNKEQAMSTQYINKLCRVLFTGIFFTTSIAISSITQAQGWYAGVGFGQTKINDFNSLCGDILSLLPPGSTCSSDDKDTGWKILAGNQFNQNAAVEFGYIDLGRGTMSLSGPGVGGTANWEATGLNLSLVGTLPVNNEFGVLGRIGIFRWDLDFNVSGIGGSASGSASGTDLTYGVGVKYDFNKTTGMRAEWEKFKDVGDENETGQGDIDLLSLSLVFRFQ